MVIRRRLAGSAVAALALLPLAACTDGSAGSGSRGDGGPASRPPSSVSGPTASAPGPGPGPRTPATPIPPVATPIPDTNAVLGPTGWQTLLLGMTLADAQATGLFADTPDPGATGCAAWYAVDAAAIDSVTVSAGRGAIVAITVTSPDKAIATPEGMALGWTAEQVHEAFPQWPAGAEHRPDSPPTIPVPQNPAAVYRLSFQIDSVITMTLESRTQDCYD